MSTSLTPAERKEFGDHRTDEEVASHAPVTYVKIAFRRGNTRTAGLVVPYEKYKHADIGTLSRLFPYWEATRMYDFLVSPVFTDWEDAFNYEFPR